MLIKIMLSILTLLMIGLETAFFVERDPEKEVIYLFGSMAVGTLIVVLFSIFF